MWFSWLVESTNVAQEHIPLILLQPNPLQLPSALLECKSGRSAKANWERKLGLQGGCRWGSAERRIRPALRVHSGTFQESLLPKESRFLYLRCQNTRSAALLIYVHVKYWVYSVL